MSKVLDGDIWEEDEYWQDSFGDKTIRGLGSRYAEEMWSDDDEGEDNLYDELLYLIEEIDYDDSPF